MKVRRGVPGAFVLALVLPIGSVTAACSDAACGALPGTAAVVGGSVGYTLQLLGEKSGEPYVALAYSSRAGDGVAGMGWSLVADSAIHRCPPTVAQDGRDDHVRYGTGDRLCDDGTRLVAARGAYGSPESVYLTEIEREYLVVQQGDLGSPTSKFVVVGTNDVEQIYGEPLIARGVTAPLYWFRTGVRRPDGSRITYHHRDVGEGEKVLERIEWGKGARRHSVRFHYAPRDAASSSFLAGGELRTTQRLTRIEVDDGASEPLEFALFHRASQSSGRALLERIEACRGNGAARRCGIPTRIEWSDAPISFREPEPAGLAEGFAGLAPAWVPGTRSSRVTEFRYSGDFDADGFADMVMQRPDGSVAVLRLDIAGRIRGKPAIAPAALEYSRFGAGHAAAADLRHLGALQLIGASDGMVEALGWLDEGFSSAVRLGVTQADALAVFDASGDGRPDFVSGAIVAGEFRLAHHRNTSPDGMTLRFADAVPIAQMPAAPSLTLDGSIAFGTGRHLLVRSAGRIHRVVEFISGAEGGLETRVSEPSMLGIERIGDGEALFADINGDGLDDLVHGDAGQPWRVQLNHDGRFGPAIAAGLVDSRSAVARAATLVSDIDSDGADELLFPEQRLLEFCIERAGEAAMCEDALAAVAPRMDFGIYRYAAIEISQKADGGLLAKRREVPGLVGQANRTRTGDVNGDGYVEAFSPFDGGVVNGRFRAADGSMHDCPAPWSCGLHVSGLVHSARPDRGDTALDTVVAIERKPGEAYRWRLYPLANPVRALYRVPALHSPQRYLEPSRYYFTSSMYVVGEHTATGREPVNIRLSYGGGSYHTHGRGFDGFQWITEEYLAKGTKQTWWWRQVFPYRGELERSWVEKLGDNEQDPAQGSPGSMYVDYAEFELSCWGPEGHPLSERFACKPNRLPVFRTQSRLKED